MQIPKIDAKRMMKDPVHGYIPMTDAEYRLVQPGLCKDEVTHDMKAAIKDAAVRAIFGQTKEAGYLPPDPAFSGSASGSESTSG